MEQDSREAREGRRRIGDPLVRAVARLPANVRTKLLIAFLGTCLLLVAVGTSAATLSAPTSNQFTIPGTEAQAALDVLSARFPQMGPIEQAFIAPTDTFARGWMQVFSDMARR